MQNGHPESTPKKCDITNDVYQKVAEKYQSKTFENVFDNLRHTIAELGEDRCFYTLDLADVLWKVQLWKEKMPNIHPFYAVKTNSDPVLLKLLVILGFSFDCATQGEIELAMQAGAAPGRIIFAHVIKSASALRYADSVGVDLMTFDCEEELDKIKAWHPKSRLLLRLAPEFVKCSFDLSDKFGCPPQDAEVVLSRAKELELNVVGVSFHVGGLCKVPESYSATICAAEKVFSIAKRLGFEFRILDIGGGFTGDNGSDTLFDEMTQAIKSSLKNYFTEDIDIIAEPGTFFVGSAATLTTTICGKKKRRSQTNENSNEAIERYYYLNDSIYGSFFVGIEEYGAKPTPFLDESDLEQRTVYRSKVWGGSCCGVDCVMPDCLLPDMEPGESIVWENMGAYCRVLCSTFCGMPVPTTQYVFTRNDSLSSEWIDNIEEVTDFISQNCYLVKNS